MGIVQFLVGIVLGALIMSFYYGFVSKVIEKINNYLERKLNPKLYNFIIIVAFIAVLGLFVYKCFR